MRGIRQGRRRGQESSLMYDLLFLGLGLAGFLAMLAYARYCDRS